jgi:hypothetical protein
MKRSLALALASVLVGGFAARSHAQSARSGSRGLDPVVRPLQPGVPQVEPAPLGDDALPPWVDVGDVPVPSWSSSVAPNKLVAALYSDPG